MADTVEAWRILDELLCHWVRAERRYARHRGESEPADLSLRVQGYIKRLDLALGAEGGPTWKERFAEVCHEKHRLSDQLERASNATFKAKAQRDRWRLAFLEKRQQHVPPPF